MLQETSPIDITPSAVAHLKKQAQGKHVRLSVEKGGCSGLSYLIEMVDEAKLTDLSFSLEQNLSLFVAEDALVHLKGMRVDFVKKGFNGQLKFFNPNAKHTCGCGESFGT